MEASTSTGLAWGLRATQDTFIGTSVPQFAFRCVSLDVARRYHSVSTLRALIRAAAVAKIRFVQLHLTDDQNWMFPTTIFAGVSMLNRHKRPPYTVSELKELQEFASCRGVSLIPEIDLPGHSSMLVEKFPELAIPTSASRSCVDFSNPVVRAKVKLLLAEVCSIFDRSTHVHLGGDEASYSGMANAEREFLSFVGLMCSEISKAKKVPIVWEGFPRSAESLTFRAAHPDLLVVSWEGMYYPPDALISDGFKIINAGWDPLYVVGHYPNDNYTMASPAQFARFDPYRFGHVVPFVRGKLSMDLARNSSTVGAMMCWWEGHEWDALKFLPTRIIAFGERTWNARAVPSQARLDNLQRRWQASAGKLDLGPAKRSGDEAPSENLALGAKVTVDGLPSPEFPPSRLTDGIISDRMSYWMGYLSPQTAVSDETTNEHTNAIRAAIRVRHLRAPHQRRRPSNRRRVAGREPVVGPARAPRPPRREERLRAG